LAEVVQVVVKILAQVAVEVVGLLLKVGLQP
jgi:hypothetical protein